jgi:hypothetical protein
MIHEESYQRTLRGRSHFFLYGIVVFQRLLSVILIVSGALVALSTAFCVYKFGSAVLIWDQWVDFRFIKLYLNGNLQFFQLFDQHNEHRIFFPRLIFFLDYFLSDSTNGVNFIVNIAAQFGTLIGLGVIYWKIEKDRAVFVALVSLASILLFSLGQKENFMWGFQVGFISEMTAAAAAFLFFGLASDREARGLSSWTYRILSYSMAFIATYTLSNGILCAFILIPLAVVQRASKPVIGITMICAALFAVSYFDHFKPTPNHAPYVYSVTHPVEYARYVSAYLGNPLSVLNEDMGFPLGTLQIGFGFVGICLTVAALWRVIRFRDDGIFRSGLVAVMSFVFGTAMLTALGRVTFGLEQAFAERYITPVSVFWAAHIFYWTSLRSSLPRGAVLIRYGGPIFVLPIAVSCVLAHADGWHRSVVSFLSYNRVQDAFLSDVYADDAYRIVFPIDGPILDNLGFLRQHRLSVFAPADNRILGQALVGTFPVATAGACLGTLDTISAASSTGLQAGLMADGWAWDTRAKRRVDRIFITNAAGTVIGFGSGGWWRPDVPKALSEVRVGSVGWKGFLKAGPNEVVRAYAQLADHHVCQFAEQAASVD